MKATLRTILVAAAGLILQVGAAAEPRRIDTTPPLARMVMNDGANAGDIILTDWGVLDIPPYWRTPISPPATMRLSALGCKQIDDDRMEAWSAIYPEVDLTDPIWHDHTYFFREAVSTRSFTVTASDASGIKRVTVYLWERDVVTATYNPQIVIDDGPSEFFNVSPSSAVASLVHVWGDFETPAHYRKQLVLEPRQTRLPRDTVLHFDLTDFGAAAYVAITVEDNAGNTSAGWVILAPRSTCID